MRRRRAFTLTEVMLVVVILAIVAGVVMPRMGDDAAQQLVSAARKLDADICRLQALAVARSDLEYELAFKPGDQRWYAAIVGHSGTPLKDPVTGEALVTQLGPASPMGLTRVRMVSVDMHDCWDRLRVDALGAPHFDAPGTVVLEAGGRRLTVAIAPVTGEVSMTW